jgi:acetylornithine deacetylase/succinyl-diaminopimelate desuccinylase-like protein
VQIGGIEGGHPRKPVHSPQLCHLYVDVRSVPGQDALSTREELRQAIGKAGLNCEVEMYHYRPGYEAQNVQRFADAVRRAHRATFGEEPPAPFVETASMWRDVNAFIELGIPAITYGPRSATHSFKRALTIQSLHQAACAYARIALEVCNQDKR